MKKPMDINKYNIDWFIESLSQNVKDAFVSLEEVYEEMERKMKDEELSKLSERDNVFNSADYRRKR